MATGITTLFDDEWKDREPLASTGKPSLAPLLGSFFPRLALALLVPSLYGCGAAGEPPLVIATTWPPAARSELEVLIRDRLTDRQPVEWVELGSGEKLAGVLDRRGGVDLLLGGLPSEYAGLAESGQLIAPDPSDAAPWRTIQRPKTGSKPMLGPPGGPGDTRDDPSAFALAKSVIEEDWVKGYEKLVRRSAAPGSKMDRDFHPTDCVALTRVGRNPERTRSFLLALTAVGLAQPPKADAMIEARADGLLADLLASALVDAHDELQAAEAALRRYGHPPRAEASIGERPPWPPASVLKLRSVPGGELLLETLAEQVAPDPAARAWLSESWSKPKRPIDRALLVEIAAAADGRLAREPRFRAWLRSEWTAWTRQLYRRVARLAGGYVPS
jgi:hypothetical protein